jgi:hypothetical protein
MRGQIADGAAVSQIGPKQPTTDLPLIVYGPWPVCNQSPEQQHSLFVSDQITLILDSTAYCSLPTVNCPEPDWVPDELAAFVGKAGGTEIRSPFGDCLENSDLDADLNTVAALFSRQAASNNQ